MLSATIVNTNYIWNVIGWKNRSVWIGGQRSSGNWRWHGRVNSEIVLSDWEQVQPDPNRDGYCLQVFGDKRAGNGRFENYKWDDTPCSGRNWFVCEKSL